MVSTGVVHLIAVYTWCTANVTLVYRLAWLIQFLFEDDLSAKPDIRAQRRKSAICANFFDFRKIMM